MKSNELKRTKIDLRDNEGNQSPMNVKKFIDAIGDPDREKFCGYGSYDDIKWHYLNKASFVYIGENLMISLSTNSDESKEYFRACVMEEIKLKNII